MGTPASAPSFQSAATDARGPIRPLALLKLGGELIEEPGGLSALAAATAELARTGPLVLVHGGGREIDAELARRGIEKRAVDGIRITDEATLAVVVAVLAGTVNTRLVAALVHADAPAVGLTGADARLVPVTPAPAHQSVDGRLVDLGRVGQPIARDEVPLLRHLCAGGYVPVVASIGIAGDGRLYNVNADTLAADLAMALGATRLIIAGATAGVLDEGGNTIETLRSGDIDTLIAAGRATAGMIAKLAACRTALQAGVSEIAIVDGRDPVNIRNATGTHVRHA